MASEVEEILIRGGRGSNPESTFVLGFLISEETYDTIPVSYFMYKGPSRQEKTGVDWLTGDLQCGYLCCNFVLVMFAVSVDLSYDCSAFLNWPVTRRLSAANSACQCTPIIDT